jgi:hypothetical protein
MIFEKDKGNCGHQPQLCCDSSTAVTPLDGVFRSDTSDSPASLLRESTLSGRQVGEGLAMCEKRADPSMV